MNLSLLMTIALILGGFVLLIKGSDWFVKGASHIASALGVSEFVIGLTLVAVGTSVPELASSIAAALSGSSPLITGNVIGSNVANTGLILGLAAVITPIVPKKIMFYRDGYILLAITLLVGIFFYFGSLTTWQCVLLLLIYVGYLLFLFDSQRKSSQKQPFTQFVRYFVNFGYIRTAYHLFSNEPTPKKPEKKGVILRQLPLTIVGLAAVVLGAKWLVAGSIDISRLFGLSEGVIGATVIAVGTSLPELLVTVTAARGGMADLAIGNIIGSNIGNLLLILGVSGLIAPISWAGLVPAFIFLVAITLLLFIFLRTDWRISRLEGGLFIALYIVFIVFSVV